MAKKKIGLALSGGGARGLVHIGVLEFLEKSGCVPDVIVGSSAGAVVAALYALNPDTSALRERVSSLLSGESFSAKWKSATPVEANGMQTFYYGMLHFVLRQMAGIKVFNSKSLRPAEELQEILNELFGDSDFSDVQIELGVGALDIRTGKEHCFTAGRLADTVYASAAIPGVFPPAELNGMMLVDGGFVSHCPVHFARKLGADYVIAVDAAAKLKTVEQLEAAFDIASRTDEIARHKLAQQEIRTADLVIEPDTDSIHWTEFSNWELASRLGYKAAEAKQTEIAQLRHQRNGNWLVRLFARGSSQV